MKNEVNIDVIELLKDSANDELQIYVHVPFCKSRCIYCDFYTFIAKPGSSGIARFVNDIKKQADALLSQKRHKLTTLYFGGGTPSFLGESVFELVAHITSLCDTDDALEISVEVNPESCSLEFIQAAKAAGVTRISLGVQALDEEVLKRLSRATYLSQVRYTIGLLKSEGIDFSLDFIAGIPGVGTKDFSSWIEEAVISGAKHLSIYPLSIEERTPLAQMIASGEIPAPDEDLSADQLLAAQDILEAAGFKHYEISNYAKPGFESKHNSGYWQGAAYLGLGPHASSMLYASGGAKRFRFMLHEDLTEFYKNPQNLTISNAEVFELGEIQKEDAALALRLFEGLESNRLKALMGEESIARFLEFGILEEEQGWIAFSKQGWLLGNEVFEVVWHS